MDVADLERSLDQIMVVQRGAQFVELHREIGGLHLAGQCLAQRGTHAARTIDVPLVSGDEYRREKREALNVIPMRVADQQVATRR